METFRYNTSAEHLQTKGYALTLHTLDKNRKKNTLANTEHSLFTDVSGMGGVVTMVTATGPAFTHAVETCRVKEVYTQQWQTSLKATNS